MGGLTKNRKVKVTKELEIGSEIRLDILAQSLSPGDFTEITINLEKPRRV